MDATKVLMFRSEVKIGQGRHLFWLFSASQLQRLLKDPRAEGFISDRPDSFRLDDQSVPLVNLERFFRLTQKKDPDPSKYLLLQGAFDTGSTILCHKILVPITTEPYLGKLNLDLKPVPPLFPLIDAASILGTYSNHDNTIFVVVPNVYTIYEQSALKNPTAPLMHSADI